MTKAEMLEEFHDLEEQKGVHIEGVYFNSKKAQ